MFLEFISNNTKFFFCIFWLIFRFSFFKFQFKQTYFLHYLHGNYVFLLFLTGRYLNNLYLPLRNIHKFLLYFTETNKHNKFVFVFFLFPFVVGKKLLECGWPLANQCSQPFYAQIMSGTEFTLSENKGILSAEDTFQVIILRYRRCL